MKILPTPHLSSQCPAGQQLRGKAASKEKRREEERMVSLGKDS
jgi:hypothetical protein